MKYFTNVLLLFCVLCMFSLDVHVQAQWSITPTENNPICTAASLQWQVTSTTDCFGGAILCWQDTRREPNLDIYVQRIDMFGHVQWTVDGISISGLSNMPLNPAITSDSSGGAIITWCDSLSGSLDIYAQRINSSGVVQWATNGVAISTAVNTQRSPNIISDGTGGAIITWIDQRSSSDYHIYAQRINSAGIVQWTTDGEPISTATHNPYSPVITSDGAGGAIIAWPDYRNPSDIQVYAQRINSAGTVQWTVNGEVICGAIKNQGNPTITSDGTGGAIITWSDNRNGSAVDEDIYAQRINSAGVVQWIVDGVPVSTATGLQQSSIIVSDGSGGAIISWIDDRNGGSNRDIYAQRLNSSGAVQWNSNGVVISAAANTQEFPAIVSDESGGAVITWTDRRNSYLDIYAQRINNGGIVQWTQNGIGISTVPATNQKSPTIVSEGGGDILIAWVDDRNYEVGSFDIYSQWVSSIGNLGNSSSINGKIFVDINGNCTQDPGEYGLANQSVRLDPGPLFAMTDANGEYHFQSLAPNVYTVSEVVTPNYNQVCPMTPGTYTVNLAYGQDVSGNDFGNQVTLAVPDLAVGVVANFPWPLRSACCGQTMTYQVSYSNPGTVPASNMTLELHLDSSAQYQTTTSSYPLLDNPIAIAGNILVYNLPSPLNPGASGIINVNVLLTCTPPSTPVISTSVYIDTTTDVQPSNNFTSVGDSASCSLDPNDMSVLPKGCGVNGYVTSSDSFTYLIRFQNLGTGPAYHVVIRDTLDSDLDASTVTTLGSSHPCILTRNGNELIWTFWGIVLPTETTNELESHGYVRFKVNQHASNPAGTVIQNRAGIYFDINLPVITNKTTNTTTADPVPSADFVITPNCVGNNCTYNFTYTGGTPGATFDWNFGSGATPATSTDQNPTGISYSTFSVKVVSLRVSLGGCISEPTVKNFTNPSTAPQFNVQRRWNLVSLPYQVVNYTKSAIFPDATSNAFAFEGGYNAHDTLRNGIGYWLKFGYAHNIFLNGTPITSDSVELAEGWNLIGSISQPIAVSNISSIPPGLVTSQFFSYGTGYTPATMIEPGKGYWVKVNESGTLLLTSILSLSKSSQHGKIKIVATSELPPPPPDGEINTTTSVLPDKFSLTQNYPNPFNPTTKFGFRMADFGIVTLKVYDVFGREVSTLLDRKEYESGEYEILFNAANLATGVYFYRINIVGQDGIVSYTDIKRAILIK